MSIKSRREFGGPWPPLLPGATSRIAKQGRPRRAAPTCLSSPGASAETEGRPYMSIKSRREFGGPSFHGHRFSLSALVGFGSLRVTDEDRRYRIRAGWVQDSSISPRSRPPNNHRR